MLTVSRRVCGSVVCCWLGRGSWVVLALQVCCSCLELSSAVVRPGRVTREVVDVSVGSIWLQVDVEVVFPFLSWSSLFSELFLLGCLKNFRRQIAERLQLNTETAG